MKNNNKNRWINNKTHFKISAFTNCQHSPEEAINHTQEWVHSQTRIRYWSWTWTWTWLANAFRTGIWKWETAGCFIM